MEIPGSISSLVGGAQAQFSNLQGGLASLADKVSLNGLKDLASKGVDKLSGAASGLFAKSPAAAIATQFPTNALPKIPPKADATPPPPAKPKVPAGALTYPTDLKYYAMFKFVTYKRVLATDKPEESYTATIILPMPANLSEAFSIDYQTHALGVAGAASDVAIRAAREAQGASGGVRGAGSDITTEGVLTGAITNIGAKMLGDKAAGDIARIATGLTPNPYEAVIFNNVKLREHTFTYRFAPNSQPELETVKKIIKQLKKSMLPSFIAGSADTAFSFPDYCEISFGPKQIYKMKKSVMTGMSINYSPNGPAFFKTGDPVIVEISMMFREIEPYTRRDEGEADLQNSKFTEAVTAAKKAVDDKTAAAKKAAEDAAAKVRGMLPGGGG